MIHQNKNQICVRGVTQFGRTTELTPSTITPVQQNHLLYYILLLYFAFGPLTRNIPFVYYCSLHCFLRNICVRQRPWDEMRWWYEDSDWFLLFGSQSHSEKKRERNSTGFESLNYFLNVGWSESVKGNSWGKGGFWRTNICLDLAVCKYLAPTAKPLIFYHIWGREKDQRPGVPKPLALPPFPTPTILHPNTPTIPTGTHFTPFWQWGRSNKPGWTSSPPPPHTGRVTSTAVTLVCDKQRCDCPSRGYVKRLCKSQRTGSGAATQTLEGGSGCATGGGVSVRRHGKSKQT